MSLIIVDELSDFYFFDLRFLEMAHVRSGRLIHKRSIRAIRFRQAYFVWNVWVYSLVSCSLSGEWWIILLHKFFLHSDSSFFLVSFLISDHLQVLYLSLGSRRQTFLHPLTSILENLLYLLSFFLILDDVGLTHWQLRNSCLHLASEISESALELVDFLRDLESWLSTVSGITL